MSCKRNIYFSLIHSILVYGIHVYAIVAKSLLKPLIIKCNRLLRLLQSRDRRSHAFDLYSSYRTLPVNLLFQFHIAKLVHKSLFNNSQLPPIVLKKSKG